MIMYGGDIYMSDIEGLDEEECFRGIEPEYALKGSCLLYDSYVEPIEYKEDSL